MDVRQEARFEAATLTNREIKRGFHHACASFTEYASICDVEQAAFAMHWLNCLLDVYNDRRRGKR